MRLRLLLALLALVITSGRHAEAVDAPAVCPKALAGLAQCFAGQDQEGAFYWMAMPAKWNGVLVVHAHGGPRLSVPTEANSAVDLARFAVIVEAGYAWVNSSYRRPGFGVQMAIEDSEHAREAFIARFGKPRRTIAHGQSWGGNVMAKLDEAMPRGADGKPVYDGVLLTSGMLGGGTHGYDFRIDLRAVYQYYCHNHPRPDETQYPLNIGLPPDSRLSRADLVARVDQCTGVGRKAAERTPAQARALHNILSVVQLPERTLVAHLAWATFMFRDIVAERLGGKSPFGNIGVVYRGSDDDATLNRDLPRFAADPAAVAALAADADLAGRISVPTLTMHAADDPTAFVEVEARYRASVAAAGKSDLLLQNFVEEHEHSVLTAPEYPTALDALLHWIDTGRKPTAAGVAAACADAARHYPGRCSFLPEFRPRPFDSRIYPRG